MEDDPFGFRRRGVTDERVLAAMATVPRRRFVWPEYQDQEFADHPLPIGHGQTISQPLIVAWMTELLGVRPGARILEIGTGSGYQTAILAELGADVWSIETEADLSAGARVALDDLGYGSVHLRVGDGYAGWPEAAPFDGIMLTAAPADVPSTLTDQLADGGRLVAPVGTDAQVLVVIDRTGHRLARRESWPVRFVAMR